MEKLIQGARSFREDAYPAHSELFEHLVEGQQPKVLFITCADSRVVPSLVTQTRPGDMMVIRNAGNIVPPSLVKSGEAATVEFCVIGLRVEHIVVCGHSNCGAMKCLIWPEHASAMPTVGPWVAYAEPARHRVRTRHPSASDPEVHALTARENVVQQLDHLRTFPCVTDAIDEGRLHLHGWYYDIGTGEVQAYDAASGEFGPLE